MLKRCCFLIAVLSQLASAQPTPDFRGLVAGVDFIGVAEASDSAARASGLGLGGLIGYGVSRSLLFHLTADIGRGYSDGWRTIAHSAISARWGSPGCVSPYMEVGLGSRLTELTGDRQLVGTGLVLGLGFEARPSRSKSIDIRLLGWWAGTDDVHEESRVTARDVPTRGRSTRIMVGIRRRPVREQQDACAAND